MTIVRKLVVIANFAATSTAALAGSMPTISGGGTAHPTPLSSSQAATVRSYVSSPSVNVPKSTAPNEGRAELFFSTIGDIGGKAMGATASKAITPKADGSGANAIANGGAAVVSDAIGRAGREAGGAVGREFDVRIDAYRKRTGYNSQNDPRFNPWPE